MSIPNQNIGKLHHYNDAQLNTEFDRIYDFLAFAKYPENSISGFKLQNGSVPESKLIGPISAPIAPGLRNTTIVTGEYTVVASDDAVLVDATSGTITVTLPAAANATRVTIKKTDTTDNVVTIQGQPGDLIDGEAAQGLLAEDEFIEVIRDVASGNWFIISQFRIHIGTRTFVATLSVTTVTMTAADNVLLVDATAAPVTVTLPDESIVDRTFTIKKIDSSANAVTIETTL